MAKQGTKNNMKPKAKPKTKAKAKSKIKVEAKVRPKVRPKTKPRPQLRIQPARRIEVATYPLLTETQIEYFKQLLLAKRDELLNNVNQMEDEALRKSLQSSGDLSSMPIHMADLGSDNYEQDLAVGLMDSERQILHEIDQALDRIDEGTYGICEETGKPISKARLEAVPWARYCIEYERMIEDGRARR
jgi:DnaK suppressor protein